MTSQSSETFDSVEAVDTATVREGSVPIWMARLWTFVYHTRHRIHQKKLLEEITYDKVVALHSQLSTSSLVFNRRHAEYTRLVERGIRYSILQEAIDGTIRDPNEVETLPRLARAFGAGNYVKCRAMVHYILAFVTGAVSAIILWSEVSLGVTQHVNLSIVSHVIGASTIEGLGLVVPLSLLAYLSFCSLRPLFRLRLLDFVEMVPNQGTDPYSLLFVSSYTCRLAIPTCYNVLNLVQSHHSVFSEFLGSGQTVAALGQQVASIWAPACTLVIAIIALSECCHSMGLWCLSLRTGKSSVDAGDQLMQGLEIIQRERKLWIEMCPMEKHLSLKRKKTSRLSFHTYMRNYFNKVEEEKVLEGLSQPSV